MKDHTTTPTAELLAEWGKLENRTFSLEYLTELRVPLNDRKDAIAAELDRRCSEAGIKIENGRLRMDVSSNCGEWRDAAYENASVLFYFPAADLRDMLTWLLLKGGNG